MTPQQVPDAVFHTRVRNDALDGPNPFEWKDLTTDDVFANKNIVVFALPGAFTPACSDSHLPGYERLYKKFVEVGIDQVSYPMLWHMDVAATQIFINLKF